MNGQKMESLSKSLNNAGESDIRSMKHGAFLPLPCAQSASRDTI